MNGEKKTCISTDEAFQRHLFLTVGSKSEQKFEHLVRIMTKTNLPHFIRTCKDDISPVQPGYHAKTAE